MARAVALPLSEEKLQALRAEVLTRGGTQDVVDRLLAEPTEMWKNHKYTVHVDRRDDGSVAVLSIRRNDRRAAHDWRDFQRIKNEIAGTDVEAVELYPAEQRLMDTANQYWLWCLSPGERFPFGYNLREPMTATAEQAARVGAKQRGDDNQQED